MAITAIKDRLFIGLIEAKSFIGQPTSYTGVTVGVVSVNASTVYRVTIGTTAVSYTSDSTPTAIEIAGGIKAAITSAAIPGVTATDNGNGTYAISATSAVQLWLDNYQDVIPASSEDSLIASLIVSAKQSADNYCSNLFVVTNIYGQPLDIDGEIVEFYEDAAPAAIPEAVKFGVLLLLKQLYFQFTASAIVSGISGPITMIKTGDQTISSGSSGSGSLDTYSGDLAELARNTLAPYKVYLWRGEEVEPMFNIEQN